MGTPMCLALWSVLASRIVINIRDANYGKDPNALVELHVYGTPDEDIFPLASRTRTQVASQEPEPEPVSGIDLWESIPAVPAVASSSRIEQRESRVVAV